MPIRFPPDHRRIETDRTPEGATDSFAGRVAAYSLSLGIALGSVIGSLLMRTALPLFGSIFSCILLLPAGRRRGTAGEEVVPQAASCWPARCRRSSMATIALAGLRAPHDTIRLRRGAQTGPGNRRDYHGRTRSMGAGLTVAEAEARRRVAKPRRRSGK
ncbi:MAG: hypothetical protein IPJ19_04310 [Planctomycetes bacterium]|nr:hypothetical protein [Planctomycetota bacterium]